MGPAVWGRVGGYININAASSLWFMELCGSVPQMTVLVSLFFSWFIGNGD